MDLDQGWVPHPLRLPQNSEAFDSRMFQGLHFSNLACWSEPSLCNMLCEPCAAACPLCREHPESGCHTASGAAGQQAEHVVPVGDSLGVGDRAVALPSEHEPQWGIAHKTPGLLATGTTGWPGIPFPSSCKKPQVNSKSVQRKVNRLLLYLRLQWPVFLLHSSVMLSYSLVCMCNLFATPPWG